MAAQQSLDHRTISEAISYDHKTLDSYAENITNAKTRQEKIQWRNQFTWTLARHAVSEELTMYPAMEKHLGQIGVELSDKDREQHQTVRVLRNDNVLWKSEGLIRLWQVKEDLFKFQSMLPDDSDFIPFLDHLLEDLHEHIEHEKNEDMPRLEEKLSREESYALAKQFNQTKVIVPTRSHPSAPNKPYFENFAAMLAAPIDRFQDLLRDFPPQEKL